MKQLRRIPIVYWVALLIPTIAASQLFTGTQMPNTADGIFHVHRIFAMSEMMKTGVLYPRWIPYFHLGYGYPVFNYYAPLGTWLGGAMGVMGVNAPLAFQLLTALSWMVGALGMTALGRRFLPDGAVLFATTLWVYAPVRMHEYWIQGSLSHIVATALVPWVFWGLLNVIRSPGRRSAIQFGVITALMVMAHQPTTYLVILYAAGLGLLLWGRMLYWQTYQALKVAFYVTSGLVVAIGLSAVFILPALLEIDAIMVNDIAQQNAEAILQTNTVNLADQFRQPQLIDHTDFSATIPHTYGLWTGVLAIVGMVSLLFRRHTGIAAILGIGTALSIFLATSHALIIWQTLPEMEQLRFPWRVLRVGIVPMSLLAAASIQLLPTKYHATFGIPAIVATILISLPTIYPLHVMINFADQTAADLIRYESTTGAIGGTSYNEFKPASGERVPLNIPADLRVYDTNPLNIHPQPDQDIIITRQSTSCWQVNTNTPTTVDYRQFYFPGWEATLDDVSLPIKAEPTYGLIRVELPASQDETLCLRYAGTIIQDVAGWITVVSIGLVVLLYVIGPQPVIPQPSTERQLSARRASIFGGGLLIASLINGLWIGPHTNWFRLQSSPDEPHDMASDINADFAYGYNLLGYTLEQDSVNAGDTLTVTLYWRPSPDVDGRNFYPILGLGNLGGTNAWAAAELPFIGTNPYNHTPSLFISQAVELTVFEDAPPFVGQIYVQLWDRTAEQLVPLANGTSSRIALPTVIAIRPDRPPRPEPPQYIIADAISIVTTNVEHKDGQLNLSVTWQTRQSLPQDHVSLFIHGLDADGNLVAQNDQLLFAGDYPPRYWLVSPPITQQYTLPVDEQIHEQIVAIAIGLYTPESRLPMRHADGEAVPDDRAVIELSR